MDDRIYFKQEDRCVECVARGVYKDHYWVITTVAGNHPCAYVESKIDYSDDEKYEKEKYIEGAHGGINFFGTLSHVVVNLPDRFKKDNFIGWDYAHAGDFEFNVNIPGKIYTVEEIQADIRMVIDNLFKEEN